MPRQRKWYSPVEALEARVMLSAPELDVPFIASTEDPLATHCEFAVPEYSSLPGANHVIYLDFNGQTVSGTSWNSVYNNGLPITVGEFGYDTATILRICERVTEDFAPYNVNVTTVEP